MRAIGFNHSDVDVTIKPEPTDAERRAIVAALARARCGDGHPAYESAWRRAALDLSDRDQAEAGGARAKPTPLMRP